MLIDLAPKLDLTITRPDALSADVHKLCADAMRRGVAAVCTAPVWTQRVARMLSGSGVRVCSMVGFPAGTSKSTIKAIEATSTIKDGADEIELVPHLPYLLTADLDAARTELIEIVRAARSTRRDVFIKVIVDAELLIGRAEMDVAVASRPSDGGGQTSASSVESPLPANARAGRPSHDQVIEIACRAVRESGGDMIVTSTGRLPLDAAATQAAVALLKKYGESLQIKAVAAEPDAPDLLAGGADRVGVEIRT